MEERIVNVLYKVAKQLLLLICLTQTHIKCDTESQYGSFAFVEYDRKQLAIVDGRVRLDKTNLVHFECGAVWISGKSVLTAASCFDKELSHPTGGAFNVKVIPTEKDTKGGFVTRYKLDGKQKLDGYSVIKHPFYKKIGDMTIAFDLAVVQVKMTKDHQNIAKLCTKKLLHGTSNWVVFAKFFRDQMDDIVMASEFRPSGLPKNHAIVRTSPSRTETYYIDPKKQFTIKHEIAEERELKESALLWSTDHEIKMSEASWFGGPVLENGCVAGIMNFGAVQNDIRYITSTNVTPAVSWINYVVEHNVSQPLGIKFWLKKWHKSFKQFLGLNRKDAFAPGKPVIQVEQRIQDTTQKPARSARANKPAKSARANTPAKNIISGPYDVKEGYHGWHL